ncbi:15215_t:CDS:2 [Gigaspora margarita]|uniref:15215_t:CDS:1 n=1 Tax=Gigaspora margarita TaxID=4874 RepID=A0ABN7UKD8_GIGMA|nr:15215_t:CDS:2 [Gigaspora margarita]
MLTDKIEDKSEVSIGTTKNQTRSEFMKDQRESELMKNLQENEFMKVQVENRLVDDQAKNGLNNEQKNEPTKGLTGDQTKIELMKDQSKKFTDQNDQPKIQEPISQGQITKSKIKKVRFSEITECQLDQDDVQHNSKEFQHYELSQSSGFYEKRQNKIEKAIDVTLGPEKATKLFGKLGLAEAWEKFVSPKSKNKKVIFN